MSSEHKSLFFWGHPVLTLSQPGITWPTPMLNVNGSRRSKLESNFFPEKMFTRLFCILWQGPFHSVKYWTSPLRLSRGPSTPLTN